MLILPFTYRQVNGKDDATRHKLIKRWRLQRFFSERRFPIERYTALMGQKEKAI